MDFLARKHELTEKKKQIEQEMKDYFNIKGKELYIK